jgi:hypothetical protein
MQAALEAVLKSFLDKEHSAVAFLCRDVKILFLFRSSPKTKRLRVRLKLLHGLRRRDEDRDGR